MRFLLLLPLTLLLFPLPASAEPAVVVRATELKNALVADVLTVA